MNDLDWYIIHPKKVFYQVQNTQIQLMTWMTAILTPLLFVFDLMDELVIEEKQSNLIDKLLWLVWVNDVSWCIEIVLSFFVANPKQRTFSAIACSYLKGYFIIDVLATIPSMITLQQYKSVNCLKFLRLLHIGEMF